MSLPSVIDLLYLIPAILLALTVHEYAHAYVSHKLGDPTPLSEGRLSLNPFHHLDLVGTLMLIVFRFGWAKPVMINPGYFKNPKKGMALVALAGPVSNFLLAMLAFVVRTIIIKLGGASPESFFVATFRFCEIFAIINIGLGIFNLIPVPPLDGSKVFAAFLSDRAYFKFTQVSGYGLIALLVLIYLGILDKPLYFLSNSLITIMGLFADTLTFFL